MENERFLLDCFRHGDERAFITIYEHYWYKLFLSAYRRIKDKAAAEELVQNLFLKLWERRATVRIDQLENYLFSSIRNATIDFLSKKMVADRYVDYQKVYASMEGSTTQEMVELNDLKEALEKGLHTLSGKSEVIFRLHRMEHWPVERISKHLHLSEKTVHYHLTKSVKFIRSYLQEFTLTVLLFIP